MKLFIFPFDALLHIAIIPANEARSIPTRHADRNTNESDSNILDADIDWNNIIDIHSVSLIIKELIIFFTEIPIIHINFVCGFSKDIVDCNRANLIEFAC